MSCFFLLWLILAIISYDVAFLSRSLTQFFVLGRSFIKLYFFLAWAALLFLLLSVRLNPRCRYVVPCLIGLIVLTMGLNLMSHLVFIQTFGLNFTDPAIAVVEGGFSGNRFIHTHTLKSVLVFFIHLFFKESLQGSADPGLAFFHFLPHWIHGLAAILIAFSALMMIYGLLIKQKEWSDRFKWPFIVIYVIATCALLKSFIDGGPLSTEFIVYFPTLLVLLTIGDTDSIKQVVKKFILCLLFMMIPISIVYASLIPESFIYLMRDICMFILFVCTVFLTVYVFVTKSIKSILLLVLFLVGLVTVAKSFFWFHEFNHLRSIVQPGTKVYYTNQYARPNLLPTKYQEGNVSIQIYMPKEKKSLWEISRQLKILPSYRLLNIVGVDCDENESYGISGRVVSVAESKQMALENVSDLFESYKIKACMDDKPCDYHYKARIKGCVGNGGLQLVAINHLREVGFKRFILIPEEP